MSHIKRFSRSALLFVVFLIVTFMLVLWLLPNQSKEIFTLSQARNFGITESISVIDSLEEAVQAARAMGIESTVQFGALPENTEWLVVSEVVRPQRKGKSASPIESTLYWRVTYLANGTGYSCSYAFTSTAHRIPTLEYCGWSK